MGISENIKGIGELVVKVHDADLKADFQQRILGLQNDCFALQEKNNTLLEDNAKLREELGAMKNKDQLIAGLEFERNVYWKDSKPYCVACVHDKTELVPLSKMGGNTTGVCPCCRNTYLGVFRRN